MKKLLLSFALLVGCGAFAQEGPTMGWSSWNTFGVNISENIIKKQADAMVSKGLDKVGYKFINIDDGYFGGRDKTTGQLLIHPTRFPHGMKTVVDYIHGKGLKAGIYSDAGHNTCGNYYNGDVIAKGVGLYEHDQQDADFFFKELGFDFIKVDFCGGDGPQNSERLTLDEQERYTAISKAIENTGRTDVRLNVCRWDYPGTWVHDVAFSWRTTHDIYDGWASVKGILSENLYLTAYAYDGKFNDMDMLEVGRSMTAEEDKTHFGMWCFMNSPLLIGCDLTKIRTSALELLKNEDLIALNQDKLFYQPYVAKKLNGCYVLVRDIEELNGKRRAFAIYNPEDAQRHLKVNFADLQLGGSVSLRDAFAQAELGSFEESLDVTVPAHGTRIYIADAEERLERVRYEAECAYISDYQEIRNNQSERTGVYENADFCSNGAKAGWLGYSEKNDLIWKNVYVENDGEYKLTIGYISGENRNITLHVNDAKIQTFSVNSGGWQTVGRRTINVQLQKGWNKVRLSNSSNWMPDIDYIEVVKVPTAVSPLSGVSSEAGKDEIFLLNGLKMKKQNKSSKAIYIKDGKKYIN